jgi:hypothetical protein
VQLGELGVVEMTLPHPESWMHGTSGGRIERGIASGRSARISVASTPVLRLDGAARYQHFIKRVADSQTAWGLWHDGWALMQDDSGAEVFPLWPAREYAEASRTGDWAEYEPEQIDLADLIDELLPGLAMRSVLPGIFPTPRGKGVTPTVEELASALRAEMKKYED